MKPAPPGYPVKEIEIVVASDRIKMIRKMTIEQLRQVLAYPLTQLTVRQAAERRLRKLEKEARDAAAPGNTDSQMSLL